LPLGEASILLLCSCPLPVAMLFALYFILLNYGYMSFHQSLCGKYFYLFTFNVFFLICHCQKKKKPTELEFLIQCDNTFILNGVLSPFVFIIFHNVFWLFFFTNFLSVRNSVGIVFKKTKYEKYWLVVNATLFCTACVASS
jgi:hypothetical protein